MYPEYSFPWKCENVGSSKLVVKNRNGWAENYWNKMINVGLSNAFQIIFILEHRIHTYHIILYFTKKCRQQSR